MKATTLALSALAIATFGVGAQASPREVRDYLARASDKAAEEVAEAGVDVGTGLGVKAQVNADGRLTGIRVTTSTGSAETDQAAVKALKKLRVQSPPNALLGADVTLAVGKAATEQAANPQGQTP